MAFLTKAANRGSIATGYDIENSLKVERTNTEYLHRTVSSAGNTKVWCASMWIKRSELDGSQQFWQFLSSMTSDGSGGYSGWPTRIGFFYSGDQLWVDSRAGTGNRRLTSVQRLRDTSAWYHIVVMQDTTQSTDTDRTKIYVNGTLLLPADLEYDQYPAQNDDTAMNVANSRICVGAQGNGDYPWSGYIADVHFLDGQTGKTASDFGEYDEDTGIWKPKAYTGAYGTNGFHLKFEDSSNMGLDSSGNGNNLTSNNISSADQATDTPTNNFCIFNPLVRVNNNPTILEGGTKVTGGGGTWNQAFGTLGAKRGKWYYEVKIANSGDTAYYGASTFPAEGDNVSSGQLMYNTSFMVGTVSGVDYYYWQNGSQVSNESTGWGNLAQNDVVGIALDLDASTKKFYLYKNGSLLNSGGTNLPTNMQDEFIFPMVVQYEDSDDQYNLGGYTIMSISSAETDENGYGTFEYAPPSGYYALCSKNLAEYGG
jgi:hypothetical protein